jgi:putative ABC transport system substrate-binding protein
VRAAFLAGMRELAYVVGRNLVFDERYAAGDYNRLHALADELIALRPDVLVAGDTGVAVVLKAKTVTIPIVMLASSDPVAAGLVQSLARPGTNVTGNTLLAEMLIAKHLELLMQAVPGMSRVAFLNYAALPNDPLADVAARAEKSAKAAATMKRLTLTIASARDPESVRQAFAQFETARTEGVVVFASGPTFQLRDEILGHARRQRLPTITAATPLWLDAGGILSYGPNLEEVFRSAATYVDKILKGSKPSELPVQQPTKFEFLVNLRAAKETGLPIPQAVLLRADRVIE